MKCHCLCFPLAESGLGAPDQIPFVGEFGGSLVHPGEDPCMLPTEAGQQDRGKLKKKKLNPTGQEMHRKEVSSGLVLLSKPWLSFCQFVCDKQPWQQSGELPPRRVPVS